MRNGISQKDNLHIIPGVAHRLVTASEEIENRVEKEHDNDGKGHSQHHVQHKAIAAYADKVKGILVTELNAGQMIEDVRLAVNGKVKVEHFGRLGGIVPDPDEIVEALAKLKIEG